MEPTHTVCAARRERICGSAARFTRCVPAASLDAVICAQSFHWFASAEALAEIRRVLVPDGVLGLIWNVRDENVPWVASLSDITDPFEAGTPLPDEHVAAGLPGPGFTAIGERFVRHAHVGSPEQVIVDRTLSVSFIAALHDEQRQEVARRLRALVGVPPGLSRRDEVAFPCETAMFAYRKTG
nr:methyltransferase domain-containing protein [Faunimonas pinastri]